MSGFPDFVPQHIYEYAYVTKSLQRRISLLFSAARYPDTSGHNLGLKPQTVMTKRSVFFDHRIEFYPVFLNLGVKGGS